MKNKRPSYRVIQPPTQYEVKAVNHMIYMADVHGIDWVMDNVSLKDLQDMIRETKDPGHQILLRDLKEFLAEGIKFRNKLHILSQRFDYDGYARGIEIPIVIGPTGKELDTLWIPTPRNEAHK